MTGKDKYCVFFNVLKFKEYIRICHSTNVNMMKMFELSIYHPTPQKFCLIL